MEAGHHEAARGGGQTVIRGPTSIWSTGSAWPGSRRARSSTRCSWLTGRATMGAGEFRPPGQLEPLTLLTALSQATRRIGLIATVSTTYNDPYNLARRLASVDHVSRGRSGWNIVTSAGADEAANFGLDDRPGHAARYARAEEFLLVAKALWDSWEAKPSSPTRRRDGTPTRPGFTRSATGAGTSRSRGRSMSSGPRRATPARAGRILGGRQGFRRAARRGDLHRAPDLRARVGVLCRHQEARSRGRP